MKKILLGTSKRTVSASFEDGEILEEVLWTVGGLIKALGYNFDGELGIIDNSVK